MPPSLSDDNDVGTPPGDVLAPAVTGLPTDEGGPPRPSGSLPRLRRNQICIAVMAIGLFNLLAYTVSYGVLGGDAYNGWRQRSVQPDGVQTSVYYIRGHFVHTLIGRERIVSRAVWIYSYIHSISVPLTSGAMIISMLVLVRPHVLATMRNGVVSGRAFVIAFGAIVALISVTVAAKFTWHLIEAIGG